MKFWNGTTIFYCIYGVSYGHKFFYKFEVDLFNSFVKIKAPTEVSGEGTNTGSIQRDNHFK